MTKAARAIIIEGNKTLVMYRNKQGNEYFTLVGGQIAEGESMEQALVREVKEETGLHITGAQLVFIEDHQAPYNQQFIYLCTVAPHSDISLGEYSEEYEMNKLGVNIHKPVWVDVTSFEQLPFRTPNLHMAIIYCLRKGFPAQPVGLTGNDYYAEEVQLWRSGLSGLPKRLAHKLRKPKH